MPRTSRANRSNRSTRSSRSEKNKSEGKSDNFDVENQGGEITIGFEAAGIGASITISNDDVVLSVGIGIASVEMSLSDPNNSTVSYVWDLYEIEGEREGCYVTLTYRIKGIGKVKEEVRRIPECSDEEPEPEPGTEPEPPSPPPPGTSSPIPAGNPFDRVVRILWYHQSAYHIEFEPINDNKLNGNYIDLLSFDNDGFPIRVRWPWLYKVSKDWYDFMDRSKPSDAVDRYSNIVNNIYLYYTRLNEDFWPGGIPYYQKVFRVYTTDTNRVNLPVLLGTMWCGYRHQVDAIHQKLLSELELRLKNPGDSWSLAGMSLQIALDFVAVPVLPPPPPPPPPPQIGDDMDSCCKRLLKLISAEQYPLKIPKRWVDRKTKFPIFDDNNKETYVELSTMQDLTMAIGTMLDRFEELFNPAGEDSAFPLKAKDANWLGRMMGQTGDDYQYPDPDDERKPEDNRQIKSKPLPVNNYMDIFKYLLESNIRLENVLPYAEMSDSEIDKGLLWPKHQGNYKITNLIQFQECLFLYLNNIIGDPTVSIVLKDANPAIAGDQPLTTEFLNLSDIMRKAYRQGLDTANDVDLGNNFNKRSLYELLIIHQTLVCVHELCESIAEDLDFKEIQEIIPVPMAADPYAGRRDENGNFIEDPTLDENTEDAIETNLDKFLIQSSVDVKVSRKDPAETTSLRDLIAQIGRYAAEAAASQKIPNSPEAIQSAIDAARAAIQAQGALTRLDVQQAITGGRYKKKKPKS